MTWAVYEAPGRVVVTWPGAAPLRLTAHQARALAAGLLVIAEEVDALADVDFDTSDLAPKGGET